MFSGIALALSEIPTELIEQYQLTRRIYQRGGEPEIQFHLWDEERVLPVIWDGRMQIVRWGIRRGQSKSLPCTAWTWRETLDKGGWNQNNAQEIVIPATMGYDRGVWFHVFQGVRGVVVRSERNEPVVYVIVEPATHYYQVMTRSEWMPSLVGELI